MKDSRHPVRSAFAIFTHGRHQEPAPAWYDARGFPAVYRTELEARREIAGYQLTLIRQFLDGERDYADAMTVEDRVYPVSVWSDGGVSIEDGPVFGKQDRASLDRACLRQK